MNFFEHRLTTTKPQSFTKITELIRHDVAASGISEGVVVVFSPHTTAGITINENADPDVVSDILGGLERAYPTIHSAYRHREGNSHAHIKTSEVGASQTVIIHEGSLVLGIWQDLYFCDFDGPRSRHFYAKVLAG